MKFLILTQKVDLEDDILGFFHGWLKEFSQNFEKVTVICLKEGKHNLPVNVKVLSLGKESGRSRLKYLYRFFKYIIKERKNYDSVFVHMNPEYTVLGGILWKLMNKKVGLWYAHGYTPLSLRVSARLANIIFTSTASGCRIKSQKVRIVGQGIDTDRFNKDTFKQSKKDFFQIITVGRISPVKDYKTLIKTIEFLIKEDKITNLKVNIIGDIGLPEQKEYLINLKKIVSEKDLNKIINFVGSVPNKDILDHLKTADLFVNMSYTGSLDKAILEAMSCGLPILTCNEALTEVLGDYQSKLMYAKGDFQALAEKIKYIINLDIESQKRISADLRAMVVKNHSLKDLVKKIVAEYKAIF
ncbi:glycosyltransferase family 4 protein [Patescibacteria group bacterium]|nr:glycosyltransferase family 4 protein [Patescibacteria group bacterium]